MDTPDDDVYRHGDSLIFNPFNTKNTEITLNDIQCILLKYGINVPIRNIELYKRAFVHSSYTTNHYYTDTTSIIKTVVCPEGCVPLKSKSNERMEFIGDGVLELVIKYYLYRRFPKSDEGFMTEKKIALVKNEHIGSIGAMMGLNKWFLISNHSEEKNTRTNLKKIGCLFEAFIGAIFLDFNKNVDTHSTHSSNCAEDVSIYDSFITGPGFQIAQLFIETVFETHVDWSKIINTDDNYKNILQVKIQKEFKITPTYIEISRNIDHGYEMGVFLCIGNTPHHFSNPKDSVPYITHGSFSAIQEELQKNPYAFIKLGVGIHKIKKKAEQIASNNAIIDINNS